MAVTEQQIQDALKGLIDPNTRKDFVSDKAVRNLKVDGDRVSVELSPYDLSKGRIVYRFK